METGGWVRKPTWRVVGQPVLAADLVGGWGALEEEVLKDDSKVLNLDNWKA